MEWVNGQPITRWCDIGEAGVFPFGTKGQSVWSILRRTTPRRLARCLAGDLDAIVLKAIHQDPDRRYGSPADLASARTL